MRRHSFFHALTLSFFSKELYQDVARHWTGTGFLYLFFLLALAWVPEMAKVHFVFGMEVQRQAPELVKDFPKITITNGRVDTDPPGRHEIKEPESGKLIALIDASIESVNLDELPDEAIVVTRTKLVMKQKDRRQTRIHDLAEIQNFSMDRHDAERWLRAMGRWLALVAYPFLLLFSFVYRICQALVYSVVGLAFRGSTGPPMDYATVLRLACVAVTPAVLVDVLANLAAVRIPMWWFICFLIAMYYLWFGVHAAKEAPAPAPDSPMPPPPIAG